MLFFNLCPMPMASEKFECYPKIGKSKKEFFETIWGVMSQLSL